MVFSACHGREDARRRELIEKSRAAQTRTDFALKDFKNRMALFRMKAQDLPPALKKETVPLFNRLEEKKTAVQLKREELAVSSLEESPDIVIDLNRAVDDLEEALTAASGRFP